MTKSVRCLGVAGMVVGLLIAGASSAAAQEVRPRRTLGSCLARQVTCAVQGQESCNVRRSGTTETVFDFRNVCFRSLLGINDEVLADSDRFPCAQDGLPGIELGERFGDFTNATMTVWKSRNTGKLVLHDLKFVKALGTSADDKALLKEYEHAVDLVNKLLGVSVTCPGLVDLATNLGRQHLNPMDRRIKSQTLLNLAKGQKVEITATEASYVIRAGRLIQTSAPIVEIRFAYSGPFIVRRPNGQNLESVKELTLGPDCSDLLSMKMRVLQEQSKLRELERVEQQRQLLASIQEELKRVREAKAAAEKSECAKSCSISKSSSEKISVAEKLGQCDFLLNKDFKKDAKFYLCLFSASWCGPCRREMPRIAKTYAETLKDDPDIELIHFSRDQNDEKAMAWAKEHDVKFPVVKPKGGNPLDLHARGIPHLFIIKADGTLVEEGHPMKLFTDEKLREINGCNSMVGAKTDGGDDDDTRSAKKTGLCQDRLGNGSTSKLDFGTREEIGRLLLLRSSQPRKKIIVPQRDSSTELPVFTNPAEGQRKAKELGLWMFVYNTFCPDDDEFHNSPFFVRFISRHCVFIKVKDSGEKFAKCQWERVGSIPHCRILDSDGMLVSPIAEWSGVHNCEVSGERMVEIFKGFITACDIMPAAFDAVERDPDEAGLAKLHEALSSLPESFVNIVYLKWAELLVKVDRSGERGWRSCYSYVDKVLPLQEEFRRSDDCRFNNDYWRAKDDKDKYHDFLSRIDRVAFDRRISAFEDSRKRIESIDGQCLSDEARYRLAYLRKNVEESYKRLSDIQRDISTLERLRQKGMLK